jgi:hypothetical protein
MAGFAIHLRLIHQYPNYVFNVSANSIAQQESQILDTMTTIDQLECLANNASKVILISSIKIIKMILFNCRFMCGIQKLNRCS